MFVNDYGVIELKRRFPKRMSWKEAKKRGVEKWQFIFAEVQAGRRVYDGGATHTCALCYKDSMSTKIDYQDNCESCPVKTKTGKRYCEGSPLDTVEFDNLDSIQAQIDFLKSL